MRAFSQVFLTLPTVANIRGLESIAVALCCAIAICLSGIANAETETYAWSGTILSVDVDNGTEGLDDGDHGHVVVCERLQVGDRQP